MSAITTHILDTAVGKPAAGVSVVLEISGASGWQELGRGKTDDDGRIKDLMSKGHKLEDGRYTVE